jgi:hypothetical protein
MEKARIPEEIKRKFFSNSDKSLEREPYNLVLYSFRSLTVDTLSTSEGFSLLENKEAIILYNLLMI